MVENGGKFVSAISESILSWMLTSDVDGLDRDFIVLVELLRLFFLFFLGCSSMQQKEIPVY